MEMYELLKRLTDGFRMTSEASYQYWTNLFYQYNGVENCGADLDQVNQFAYVIAYLLNVALPC